MKFYPVLSRSTEGVLHHGFQWGNEPVEISFFEPKQANRIVPLQASISSFQYVACLQGEVHWDGRELIPGSHSVAPIPTTPECNLLTLAPWASAMLLQVPDNTIFHHQKLPVKVAKLMNHTTGYHLQSILTEILSQSTDTSTLSYHIRSLFQASLGSRTAHELKLNFADLRQLVEFEKDPSKIGAAIRSIQQLSKGFGIKSYKLKLLVRAIFSSTTQCWLNAVKMKRARQLLANKDLTIEFIAKQLFYQSDENFITAFKRYYGLTPHVFRNQILISQPAPHVGTR